MLRFKRIEQRWEDVHPVKRSVWLLAQRRRIATNPIKHNFSSHSLPFRLCLPEKNKKICNSYYSHDIIVCKFKVLPTSKVMENHALGKCHKIWSKLY